jgi:hypothetical protein
MKLYLISQIVNNGYDTYDSAVVAAPNQDDAVKIVPGFYHNDKFIPTTSGWADSKDVRAEYIGTAKPGTKAGTVICASYNAG